MGYGRGACMHVPVEWCSNTDPYRAAAFVSQKLSPLMKTDAKKLFCYLGLPGVISVLSKFIWVCLKIG